jgi:hypothetical protein
MNSSVRLWLAPSVLGLGALLSTTTSAADLEESGAVACTGNTNAADAVLSKGVFGVSNGSGKPVFVTCALQTVALHIPPNDSQMFGPVRISFSNNNIRAMTLRCTAVPIVSGEPFDFFTEQASAPAGGRGVVSINASTGRFGADSISVTCALPSRVTIQSVFARMTEFEFTPME